jgi:hypothetical protein
LSICPKGDAGANQALDGWSTKRESDQLST